MNNIYVVTTNDYEGDSTAAIYRTLNKEKAEEIFNILNQYRDKYPKYNFDFNDSQFAEFSKVCDVINAELSSIIGKKVDLSYLTSSTTIVLRTYRLDDELEAT